MTTPARLTTAALIRAVLACAAVAAPLPALAQYARADESWSRPDASYLQYRTDAVECAYKVGQEAPVKIPKVDLTFPVDVPDPPPGVGYSDESYQIAVIGMFDAAKARMTPEWRKTVAQVQPALARCLTDRGYHRFRLTKDQMQDLKALPSGNQGAERLSVAAVGRRGGAEAARRADGAIGRAHLAV